MAATTPTRLRARRARAAVAAAGLVALELEGARDEIDRGVAWLRQRGVTVEPIEKNVIE